jgi:prepilin-type N-terminal cleavage/methylation domain-containing protein
MSNITNKKNKSGFTLVELLTVIAIIGILATVVTVGLGSSKAKGRDAIRMGDIASLSKAAELYFAEHSYQFPDTIDDLNEYFEGGQVPRDPKDGLPYVYTKIDSPKRGFCFGSYTEVIDNSRVECSELIDLPYSIKGP